MFIMCYATLVVAVIEIIGLLLEMGAITTLILVLITIFVGMQIGYKIPRKDH